jgi:hypothetical protein
MGFFGGYQKARDSVYDPEDGVGGGREDDRYINHECEFVGRIKRVNSGRVDKPGSKADKHPFIALELVVVSIKHDNPESKRDEMTGVAPKPLEEGELISIFQKLPRTQNVEDMKLEEKYDLADAIALVAAAVNEPPESVDLAELDELLEDDGKGFADIHVGVAYSGRANKKTGVVYYNPKPYPVNQAAPYERIQPGA